MSRRVNENPIKASYEVSMLVAKCGKPLMEAEFIKVYVMKMSENICPEKKKKEFGHVCPARYTVALRGEDIPSDVKRVDLHFFFFSLSACF